MMYNELKWTRRKERIHCRKKGEQVKDKQVLLVKAAKRMRDRKMKGETLQNKTGNKSKPSITKQEVANTSIIFFFCL